MSKLIANEGSEGDCGFCGDERLKTWSIGELADAVESAFNDHMERTGTEPDESMRALYADPELKMDWFREGQETADAIEDMARIPTAAARDIQAILADRHEDIELARMGAETEFAAAACYKEKKTDAREWHWRWHTFEQTLKTQARFFNRAGADMLNRVFGDIDQLRTSPRHPAVVTAGPNHRISHLYRARVFQSDAKLEEAICRPDLHLGAPPAQYANAGRMNAKGISVFYGATTGGVALAEVRPPVGSRVAVAKFQIIRPLSLLDLTALDHARDGGSLFDPTLKERLDRAAFLQSLGARMTRPVMPDDEAFDYLVTQAIADFLGTENRPRLDGIIFTSAQVKGGRNVVLFHAAASVGEIDLPAGTEISGTTRNLSDEGAPGYWVWERLPEPTPAQQDGFDPPFLSDQWAQQPTETGERDPALQVDPDSVKVHHIESVQVRSTAFEVRRNRS